MDLRLLLAWLHLAALGIGLAGAWARARALRDSLRDPADAGALRRAFIADAWWGVAGGLWLVSGLWRLFGSVEKGIAYYFANDIFILKLALFVAVLALEAWPMMTLIRWRMKRRIPTPRDAGRIEVISYVQCALVLAMVLAATAAARGYGMRVGSGSAAARADSAAVVPDSAARSLLPDAPPLEPSGSEVVTAEDLAMLQREIGMPLDGIDPTTLRSNFDERRGGGTRQHRALDIMAARGTPVKSAATGRVLKLFTSAAGGLMVYAADSSERFILMYAHLDAYAPGLREGVVIPRGQVIGRVGSTGNASPSAPHLHFAVARSADVKRWSRGMPIDPLPVLQGSSLGR